MDEASKKEPNVAVSSDPAAGTTVLTTTASLTGGDSTTEDVEKITVPSVVPAKRSKTRSVMIVAACTGTQILNVCGVAAVATAMPVTARDLRMSSDTIPWIVSAFALSSGCLLLLFGRLADLYGRKLVWQCGAVWTILMTLASALSRTGVQLIILRAMAGAGPAAMVPAAIGILAHSFPPSRARSTAFATFSAGGPVGATLGMVFGGVMTEYASWRGLYYFLIGLSVAVLVAGVFAIERDLVAQGADKRVDWVGAFLVTAGLTLITFSLSYAATAGWSSPLTISLLIVGLLLVGSFVGWEYHLIHRTSFPPLMPLDIWTRDHGRFAAMQAVGFMAWACFNTLVTYASLYYQYYLQLSPLHAIIRFIPMPIVGFICNVVVALVVGAISGAYLLGIGLLSAAASALLYALIDPNAPYWQYGFPAAIICVLGADFTFACGTLFIAKIAHPHEQSVAGALFQTVTSLGTSVGLSITTVVQVAGMQKEARRLGITVASNALVSEIPPPVLLKGYRAAQYTGVGFGLCGLVIVVVFLNGIGVVGTKKKQKAVPVSDSIHDEDEKVDDNVMNV